MPGLPPERYAEQGRRWVVGKHQRAQASVFQVDQPAAWEQWERFDDSWAGVDAGE